jgi:hypothetical protein
MLLKPDVRTLAAKDDAGTLVRATRHWSPIIRADSAAALGALRMAQGVPALIRLLEDSRSDVREAAARALGDIGALDALEPLIAALRRLNSARNDRPGDQEFEFEAIAEALGRLDNARGIEVVMKSGTVCFREGVYSVSRAHVGGLCLSGGTLARAELIKIIGTHYLYEPYSLVGVVEALDYLRERHITASLMDILRSCVESMRSAWSVDGNGFETSDRNIEALALAAARAVGRLDTKRAEPVLIDLLLRLPTRALGAHGSNAIAAGPLFPAGGVAFADMRHAILTLRGEKSPADFDCARSFLQLHKYRARRHKTDVVFGGEKRHSASVAAK